MIVKKISNSVILLFAFFASNAQTTYIDISANSLVQPSGENFRVYMDGYNSSIVTWPIDRFEVREFLPSGSWSSWQSTSPISPLHYDGTRYYINFSIEQRTEIRFADAVSGGTAYSNILTFNIIDKDRNWIESVVYDEAGNPISKSRQYFNQAGHPQQIQSYDLQNNEILANESLYNDRDEIVGQTLLAPIDQSLFEYKENFATVGGTNIGEEHWSLASPPSIDNSQVGTLGHYYSSNSSESRIAETSQPYSVSNFYEDGSGESKSTSMPGDFHHLESDKVGIQKTLKALDGELRYYGEIRQLLFDLPSPSISSKIIKKVGKDGNGREGVSYQDDAGNAVASAISGGNSYEIVREFSNQHRDFEFHVTDDPNSKVILLHGGGTKVLEVTDLETNQFVMTDEEFSDGQSFVLEPGFYKIWYNVSGGGSNEEMTLHLNYTDFSYNFYDNAGRLIASMTPMGTEKLLSLDQATFNALSLDENKLVNEYFTTLYEYDFQGRLLSMTEPDAGRTEYRYRKDGQIRFSKNAEQTEDLFSYTNYDDLGRPIESGECECVNNSFSESDVNENIIAIGITDPDNEFKDWIKTYYDTPVPKPSLPTVIADRIGVQDFVMGAVSSTESESVQSWYSYDDQGRVTWYLQRFKELDKYFLIEYTYDFLGNVRMVAFQPHTETNNTSEAFYHHYMYDANQRLSRVETSVNETGARYLQAIYEYYLHGPLKRVELATDLQGIDYIYTVQGWLKAINHPINDIDPGRDGLPPLEGQDDHEHFSKDAFGMTLEYFNGDYASGGMNYDLLDASTTEYPEQNNGNIRGTVYGSAKQGEYVINNNEERLTLDKYRKPVVKAQKSISLRPGFSTNGNVFSTILADEPTVELVNSADDAEAYAYQYDEKYQLKKAKHGKATNINESNAYDVAIIDDNGESYDANGNIKGITRYDDYAGAPRDEFQFNYIPNTNQLESVDGYITLITYNDIGQVETVEYEDDNQTDIRVEYDVTGKVTRVHELGESDNTLIQFTYDDRGFRMMKQVGDVQEWYVRDASGQVMAIYHGDATKPQEGIAQIELPIYGASKLGMAFKNPDHYKYIYELTDHLGSVRALVTKLSLQATASMEPENETHEQQFFDNLSTRHSDAATSYNDPIAAGHSAMTNPAQPIGPTTTLTVKEGDEINLDVFVKYGESFTGTPAGGSIAGLLGGNVNDGAVGVESSALTNSLTNILPGIISAVSGTSGEPKAYMQYLLLDEDFELVSSGEVPVGATGNEIDGNGWEHLVFSADVTADGYLFAYVVNESNTNIHFDNFTFSILGTRVIRKTDYYPFGAVAKVWNNPDQTQQEKYRHGYQGQYAEKDTITGWNAFELRMYDPLIGRWLQVDPYRAEISSYMGMSNRPTSVTDPDGGCPSWLCGGKEGTYAVGATVTNNVGSWEYLGNGEWKDLNAGAGGFLGSVFESFGNILSSPFQNADFGPPGLPPGFGPDHQPGGISGFKSPDGLPSTGFSTTATYTEIGVDLGIGFNTGSSGNKWKDIGDGYAKEIEFLGFLGLGEKSWPIIRVNGDTVFYNTAQKSSFTVHGQLFMVNQQGDTSVSQGYNKTWFPR